MARVDQAELGRGPVALPAVFRALLRRIAIVATAADIHAAYDYCTDKEEIFSVSLSAILNSHH